MITFPEQQEVIWLRLTATSTKMNDASLHELEGGGSYRESEHWLREGLGRWRNNVAASAFVGDLGTRQLISHHRLCRH